MVIEARKWVATAGAVIACLGYECLPHGQGANATHNLSVFAQSADRGAFVSVGAVMLMAGVLIFALSFLVPER